MSANEQNYAEQMRVLQERFPQVETKRLHRLLGRFDGDVDQVGARLVHQEASKGKWNEAELRFGEQVTTLQKESPVANGLKRHFLLRIMNKFDGDMNHIQKFLQRVEERKNGKDNNSCASRRQEREELKAKYAKQLAELASAGINVNAPYVLRKLEKHQGDTEQIIKNHLRHAEKAKFDDILEKYGNEIAQLEAEGIQIKNKRFLARLFENSDGQIDVVKQKLNERKNKHQQRREYRMKHRNKSPLVTDDRQVNTTFEDKRRRELSADEMENLKRLRSAGVHGNPRKILKIFNECNQSIELTVARAAEDREQRCRMRDERLFKRNLLNDADKAYIKINDRDDWPQNIEQVYLDGNNMMFVINCLRRLCLNHAGAKTERAIGEIASAWNEKMHIRNVELIFDFTKQLDRIGTVTVSSAQPKYNTTDDMLIDIARQTQNREKNKRTIIVTSDRALAATLQLENCLLVKPYSWFAHCVMVLSPDLIDYEEITGKSISTATSSTCKIRYNFDELVHRVANIDI